MTLTNPIGLLALLAIPALVVIYCLRRKSQVIRTPTLFLIDRSREPDEGGRTLRRFRGTIPFWLQALALLLAALLLAGLHFGQIRKVGRVAVVLDSSASVAPFRDELATALGEKLAGLARGVETTEFTVLDSYPGARPLYHGTELRELQGVLADWQPRRGGHDPSQALQIARSLSGDGGVVVFATDREPEEEQRQDGVAILAAGEPTPNIGFLGVDVRPGDDGQPAWRAVVRNYADAEAATTWQIEIDGSLVGEPRGITLPPDGAVTVGGAFPEVSEGVAGKVTLVLAPDAFPLDDRLPIVRPRPKEILAATRIPRDSPYAPIVERLSGSLAHLRSITIGEPDLEFATYDPLRPGLPEDAAIVFLTADRPGKLNTGPVVVANHPLVESLTWESIIVPDGLRMPVVEADQVLVWAGDKPLIMLRAVGDGQLLFNFDVARSNAHKLPAFAVLCHRFVAMLREAKVAPEAVNIEVAQRLRVTGETGPGAPPLQLHADGAGPEIFRSRSPEEVGFFTVEQGENLLVEGAAHFGDPREADLREAGRLDTVPSRNPTVIDEARRDSPWWRAFLLAALAAAALAWHFQGRGTRKREEVPVLG